MRERPNGLRSALPGFWPAVDRAEFADRLHFSDQAPTSWTLDGTLNALRRKSVFVVRTGSQNAGVNTCALTRTAKKTGEIFRVRPIAEQW